MAKIPKHKLYGDCETLFIEQGLSCAAISEQLGITESTLSKWREQMEWDARREEYLLSPLKIRKTLTDELKWIMEGKDPRINSKALSAINKTLQLFSDRITIPVIHSVFKKFDMWLLDIDPELCIKTQQYHSLFLREEAKLQTQKK
jgi:transposase-like protein